MLGAVALMVESAAALYVWGAVAPLENNTEESVVSQDNPWDRLMVPLRS